MTDNNQSGGVNAKSGGDIKIEGDVVGRDHIGHLSSINEGTATRYAIGGIVLVAIVAILALALTRDVIREASTKTLVQTPNHLLILKVESGSQWIKQDQMIALANDKGAAVIRFIFTKTEAAYQWRYRKYGFSSEKTGTGKVYENYALTPFPGGSYVVDLGSVLSIEVADMRVGWSPAGESSGWIYYESMGVSVVDETDFSTIDLSKILISR